MSYLQMQSQYKHTTLYNKLINIVEPNIWLYRNFGYNQGPGFSPSSLATIKYDGTIQSTTPATITVGSTGSFSATITIPSSARGTHTVSATDGTNTAIATFTRN